MLFDVGKENLQAAKIDGLTLCETNFYAVNNDNQFPTFHFSFPAIYQFS